MKQPEAVLNRLRTAWNNNWTDWLGGGGTWPLKVSLDPPTEAAAGRHWTAFQAWVRTYAHPVWADTVEWEARTWRGLGNQEIPMRVSYASAEQVASALGREAVDTWKSAQARWAERCEAWPDLADELRAIAPWLGALPPDDYARFVLAFDWLASNPDTGLYVRQLPIGGLDSKWIETHAGPLARLLAKRLGREPGRLAAVAGLAQDVTRCRIRLLDPLLRQRVGGLSDLEVRHDELAALDLPARVAIVIENQQTALACTDLEGAVLIMGGGFAVTSLGRIPWLSRIPLLYWGDIDTNGLAILHSLRAWHPHTQSCLMDEVTLLGHLPLWSHEASPFRGQLPLLNEAERKVMSALLNDKWGHGVRLEQERIEWPFAWGLLRSAVRAAINQP